MPDPCRPRRPGDVVKVGYGDAAEILSLLDAIPTGVASVVLPDWPEGDPRWDVAAVEDKYKRRQRAIDHLRERAERATEDAYRGELKTLEARGVRRPVMSQTLGLGLGQLARLLDD